MKESNQRMVLSTFAMGGKQQCEATVCKMQGSSYFKMIRSFYLKIIRFEVVEEEAASKSNNLHSSCKRSVQILVKYRLSSVFSVGGMGF